MRILLIPLLLASLLESAPAAPRLWRSSEGDRSFQGEFVRRNGDKITIRRTGGGEVTFDLTKLHTEDQSWLNLNHPAKGGNSLPPPDPAAVFDSLKFGDTREEVENKLRANKLVEPAVADNIFNPFGMDAAFRTRQKVGELQTRLYFGWDDQARLTQVSLHTEPVSTSFYSDDLKAAWSELIELLTTLHGKATQEAPYPDRATVPVSGIIGSHLWKLEKGGSAMLGVSRDGEKFFVVVRFTNT